MPAFQRQIVVSGHHADIPSIAEFLDQACASVSADPSGSFDIQLAVEEACTNVIEHAYQGAGGELSVTFAARGHDVVVTIRDRGRPFDPGGVAKPDFSLPLADRPAGGLGLHLMEHLMDQVKFRFSRDDGNTLTMVKRAILPANWDADV